MSMRVTINRENRNIIDFDYPESEPHANRVLDAVRKTSDFASNRLSRVGKNTIENAHVR